MAALGKVKLEQIKKEAPGGIEAAVKSKPGSRLDQLKADKSYTEPGGKSIYYFRQGVLVSATTKATKPLTKEELLRGIKGLKFEKFPPNQTEAAFIRSHPPSSRFLPEQRWEICRANPVTIIVPSKPLQ